MHRILKSHLKMSKTSARWVPRLLSVDDCKHNPASYKCENCPTSFRVFKNDVRLWLRPTVGKTCAQTLLFDIFPPKFAWQCRNNGKIHV